ncbi:MAG: NAD-dependent epimerase/dehydratase family protein [Planctomycetota bacterium]|nr:NAD-dependent epimerase/dehydratase family protein [Planctomycetota bacterium]MDA1213570.1 NAD-dependent epimerase/dehydratase family protein [Planctomycetota bacterium]
MKITSSDTILVTGATGLVGSHFVENALSLPAQVRALVRPASDTTLLESWNVPIVRGEFHDAEAIKAAMQEVTVVIHCAAKVGDWGSVEEYRQVNVAGIERLIEAAQATGSLKKFVQISTLGVYPARDHHGSDESVSPSASGFDGYTRTKIEAEEVIHRAIDEHRFPAVILRPGFIYGPRDRTVFPKLLAKLQNGMFAYLGDGKKVLNNTYVGNLVRAIILAIENDDIVGQTFNIRDGRLVSRREFIASICEQAGYPVPTRKVPMSVARPLTWLMESCARFAGKKEAPLLSQARIKFLGLNLDFSIDKARRELHYEPEFDFRDAIVTTMNWFRDHEMIPR